jgi:hypothetical protein
MVDFPNSSDLIWHGDKWIMGENPLRCTTQDEKSLVFIQFFFTLYFDPHKK